MNSLRSLSSRATRFWCLSLLAILAFAGSARAENRFLIILDVSANMKPFGGDVLNEVVNLLGGNFSGQIRPGDTLGIWTFNDELFTGQFPLQVWEPERRQEIMKSAGLFLKEQSFEKKSRLESALLGMREVVKASEVITIVIISSGEGRMLGTPFDQEINKAYTQLNTEMKKKRMPIITVLQGQRGKVAFYNINAIPWPVVVPPVPQLKQSASQVADTTDTPPKPAPPVKRLGVGPPLIVVGDKTQPQLPPQTVPVPVVVPVAVPVIQPPVVVTSAPPPVVIQTTPPPVIIATGPPVTILPKVAAPPAAPSNVIPASPVVASVTVQTSAPPVIPVAANPLPPEKVVAVMPSAPEARSKVPLIAGVVLLFLAGVLTGVFLFRSRDTGSSLVTRSINKQRQVEPKPPGRA